MNATKTKKITNKRKPVAISAVGNGNFIVNNKIVYLDMDNDWKSSSEITPTEKQAFLEHITAKIGKLCQPTA